MPKIPVYQRKLSIPGETGEQLIDVGKATMVERANADIGLTVANEALKTVDFLKAHQEKMRQQDITNKTHIIGNQADEDIRSFYQKEKESIGESSYGSQERAKQYETDVIKKHTGNITDPELKMKVENRIRSRFTSVYDNLAVHESAQRKEVTKQAVNGTLESIKKDVAMGIVDLPQAIKNWEDMAKEQGGLGLAGKNGVDVIMKGQSEIAKEHINSIINLNPLKAVSEIKMGTYNKYLNQNDINEMVDRAYSVYVGEMINNNAEVAYSYLRERSEDGTYKNLQGMTAESRIKLINASESGMRMQRVEWNREWDKTQTDTMSKIYTDMDNKAVPRSQIRSEIEKAESTIDPKTGQRLLNPVTAHNLKRELEGEDGSGGTGSASEYGRVGNLILEGKITTDEISSNSLLSNTERKELTRMLWSRDKRGDTTEGKNINEDLKMAYSYAKDSLDAILPSVGESNAKNRQLNEAAKAYLTFKLQGRETKEDVESYKKHVGEVLQWAKENAGNKKTNARMAEQLVAGIFPENFDQANLANQEKWIKNNDEKIKAKFKNSPAGTYYMPGSKIPINWDGKGGYDIEVTPKTQAQPTIKNEQPPVSGAQKHPTNGKWYVEKEGQWYEVR